MISDERLDGLIQQARHAATKGFGGGDGAPYREVFYESVYAATLVALIANETAQISSRPQDNTVVGKGVND
jgi:hypothetical protein